MPYILELATIERYINIYRIAYVWYIATLSISRKLHSNIFNHWENSMHEFRWCTWLFIARIRLAVAIKLFTLHSKDLFDNQEAGPLYVFTICSFTDKTTAWVCDGVSRLFVARFCLAEAPVIFTQHTKYLVDYQEASLSTTAAVKPW